MPFSRADYEYEEIPGKILRFHGGAGRGTSGGWICPVSRLALCGVDNTSRVGSINQYIKEQRALRALLDRGVLETNFSDQKSPSPSWYHPRVPSAIFSSIERQIHD